ncbi:MAG: M14 family metallopeptidase [Flavobacteriaceae bacterium]|nr:M14 family metallopeptidase [Flavobacteriaceae bacterium]
MFDKNFRNEPVEIRGQIVKLGKNKLIKVEVDRLPTGTSIEIPVYVFNGKEPGPTVLIQAGLHGDEVNGVELVRRMLSRDYFKVNKGCVIIVPLLNVFGFLNLSRDLHGKDLNRSFPGSRSGSLASRIAYFHMQEIANNVDFGIDIHTGGAQRSNYPQIRYTPNCERSKKLAKVFNAPYNFPSRLIPKSFRKEASKHDVPIIVYEAGESLRISKTALKYGIEGVLNILEHFEIVPEREDKPTPVVSVELNQRKWIRAKIAGLFNIRVKNGEAVKKGQILGYITDTYGETVTSVKAPFDGYVFAVNNFPIINRGDALFHIGK